MPELTKAEAVQYLMRLRHLKFFPVDAIDNLASMLIELCQGYGRYSPQEQADYLMNKAKWLDEYPGPDTLLREPYLQKWPLVKKAG